MFGGHLRESVLPESDMLVEVWLYIVIQKWNQSKNTRITANSRIRRPGPPEG